MIELIFFYGILSKLRSFDGFDGSGRKEETYLIYVGKTSYSAYYCLMLFARFMSYISRTGLSCTVELFQNMPEGRVHTLLFWSAPMALRGLRYTRFHVVFVRYRRPIYHLLSGSSSKVSSVQISNSGKGGSCVGAHSFDVL